MNNKNKPQTRLRHNMYQISSTLNSYTHQRRYKIFNSAVLSALMYIFDGRKFKIMLALLSQSGGGKFIASPAFMSTYTGINDTHNYQKLKRELISDEYLSENEGVLEVNLKKIMLEYYDLIKGTGEIPEDDPVWTWVEDLRNDSLKIPEGMEEEGEEGEGEGEFDEVYGDYELEDYRVDSVSIKSGGDKNIKTVQDAEKGRRKEMGSGAHATIPASNAKSKSKGAPGEVQFKRELQELSFKEICGVYVDLWVKNPPKSYKQIASDYGIINKKNDRDNEICAEMCDRWIEGHNRTLNEYEDIYKCEYVDADYKVLSNEAKDEWGIPNVKNPFYVKDYIHMLTQEEKNERDLKMMFD